jgi:hypothetical protein
MCLLKSESPLFGLHFALDDSPPVPKGRHFLSKRMNHSPKWPMVRFSILLNLVLGNQTISPPEPTGGPFFVL